MVDSWKNRLVGFDYEVTAHDWLVVFIDKNTNERTAFHNDNDGLDNYIGGNMDKIFVAYNNKHYDNYIMKANLNNFTPEQVKEVNDYIIGGGNGWEYPFPDKYITLPPTCDLMLDLPKRQGLKEIEGNLGIDITESTVDFNIRRKWTKRDYEEMLYYCTKDVEATLRLCDERMGYLEAKAMLGEMCGIPIEKALYSTNAQLAAMSLGAKLVQRNDEKDYVCPKEVDKTKIPQDVLDFFERFAQTGSKETLDTILCNTPHTFGLGGIHGARKNYTEQTDDERIILNFDVGSYYPALMIIYNFLSRNVADKSIYVKYRDDRIMYKKTDKKKANALKLVLNTTYGAMLNQYNDLFDPLMGRSVCITGQLFLTQLATTLFEEIKDFILIQSNTDGIMFSIPRDEYTNVKRIIDDWCKLTKFEMEEDVIDFVVQKDVNNYIMGTKDGNVKTKGGYCSNYPKGSYDSNSLTICHKALVNYFTYGIDVDETINNATDPLEFQMIVKGGSSYDHVTHEVNGIEQKVQKVNRIYATTDKTKGVLKKWKKVRLYQDEDDETLHYTMTEKGKRSTNYRYKDNQWYKVLKTERACGPMEKDDVGYYFWKKDTVQQCPCYAIIDNSLQISVDSIDKVWYSNLVKQRINDFKFSKTKQKIQKKEKEEKKMVAKKPVVDFPKANLYRKLIELSEVLSNTKIEADGYNSHQNYEYTRASYYREMFGTACRKVGLITKYTIVNRYFTPLEGSKMNLTSIQGMISLIDPDTGEHEDYPFIADGTDNLDKGIYAAQTMSIKNFVNNNFFLGESQTGEIDPENGKQDKLNEVMNQEASKPKVEKVEEPKVAAKKPATPTQRAEAAEQVASENVATNEFVQELIDAIKEVQKLDATYKVKTVANLEKVLTGEKTISKVKAVQLMSQAEDELEKLGE